MAPPMIQIQAIGQHHCISQQRPRPCAHLPQAGCPSPSAHMHPPAQQQQQQQQYNTRASDGLHSQR